MDVLVKTNRIYWTNWHTGRISSYDLPPLASSPDNNRHRRQGDARVSTLEVGLSFRDLLGVTSGCDLWLTSGSDLWV